MLKRHGARIGMPELHPHLLRHYYAHEFLAGDEESGVDPGLPEDLMRNLGHRNMKMIVAVYGVDKAEERARKANRRLSVGDRL
jgi:integrase